ncbi:MAG: putative bifunctional diguanylate cyclase/phosphodiesterase [Telluria sp.]
MNQATILHCNVTRVTFDAIQAAFGAAYSLIQVDAVGDIAVEGRTERVAMVVIGVDDDLAELPESFNAPTVLIARQPDSNRELQALEAGAVDYLSDVMPTRVLTARLRNHLSGRMAKLEGHICELELQQRRNAKLNRSLATLSGTNSAIARLRERSVLFSETARVAVQDGGYGAAWIAVRDKDERFVIVASNGFSNDQLPVLNMLLAGDGVIRSSLESGAVEIRNATSSDGTDADSADACHRGFGALAVVPLKPWDQVEGVMALYAVEEGSFDDTDFSLLSELGQDLSFALRNFEQHDRANYLYYYDVLTGLPNFSLFLDRLTQLIYTAYSRELGVYVLVANLGHFKHVNEVWGRRAGDQVLEIVAQRLRTGLPEQANIARVAGDSFAIADLYSDNADLTLLIDRVSEIIEEPIQLEGYTLQLSARMGCATSPENGEESEVVFRNAEAALKHAKLTAQQASFYAPELNAHVSTQLELEGLLRSAIGTGQFVMHYQPKVDVRSGQIVAAEALIRWLHPERGSISPADFVPLAEDTGLIIPLGKWVIDTVCAQQAAWGTQGIPIVPVALNLSAMQFKGSDVLKDVQAALATHDVSPNHIELELTETLVMQDPAAAEETMHALRDAGLRLSLDDFGTGYSSLAHLKRFPFSSVKIDRAFVTDITTNTGAAAIAKAIIGMGHSLQLNVIAEGVETAEQMQLLRESGCDQIQGFYFSRPVPADEFAGMLRARKNIGEI